MSRPVDERIRHRLAALAPTVDTNEVVQQVKGRKLWLRRARRTRLLASVAASVVMLTALAVVASRAQMDEVVDIAVLEQAADELEAQGIAKFRTTQVSTYGTGRTEARLETEGVNDFASQTGRLTHKWYPTDARLPYEPHGRCETVLWDRETEYYRALPQNQDRFDGKEWVAFSVAAPAAASGIISAPWSPENVRRMASLTHGAVRVGSATLQGVNVSHYRGDLDWRQLLGQMTPDNSDDADAAMAAMQRAELTAALELWVDDQGVLRQARSAAEQKRPPSKSTVTAEYFDFGVQEEVQIPDPSAVHEVDDRAAALSACTEDPPPSPQDEDAADRRWDSSDLAAQSAVSAGWARAMSLRSRTGSFEDVNRESLAEGSSLDFVEEGESPHSLVISFKAVRDEVIFAARSNSGLCFAIRAAPAEIGFSPVYAHRELATCTAGAFDTIDFVDERW